jgi:hypothetical protein
MTIPNLNTSDTFKTWFDRTNTVISEVNGITIHNLLAGDGIGVTSASNVFTVSHGSLVATGVTFTGPVNFTNTTSFNISPTIDATVVNVSPVVSGITIGNIVRVTENGLTLAKADTAANAEVLGIVVNRSGNNHVVALAGSVNNNIFNNTISNMLGVVGSTLSKGCAYFLSPEIAGGITTVEPVTYGQVSKPIILGITGNVGSIIPYRGIQIEGISAGVTAELDNKIIIEYDDDDFVNGVGFLFNSPTGSSIKIGDPIVIAEDSASAQQNLDIQNFALLKSAGKINNSNFSCGAFYDEPVGGIRPEIFFTSRFLGLVSKIISQVGNKYILEITLPGGSFNVNLTDLNPDLYVDVNRTGVMVIKLDSSSLYKIYSSDFDISQNLDTDVYGIGDIIRLNPGLIKIILYPINETRGILSSLRQNITTVSTTADSTRFEYDNLLANPNFIINQRNITRLTATDLKPRFTPFADRWFFVKADVPFTGLTFEAKIMDAYENNVYYVEGSLTDGGTGPGNSVFRSANRKWVEVRVEHSGTSKYFDTVSAESIIGTTVFKPNAISLVNIQNSSRMFGIGNNPNTSVVGKRYTFAFNAKVRGSTFDYPGLLEGQGFTLNIIGRWYPEPQSYEGITTGQWPYKWDYYISKRYNLAGVTVTSDWQPFVIRGFNPGIPRQYGNISQEDEGWFDIGFEFGSNRGITFCISEPILIAGDGIKTDNLHAFMKYTTPQEDYEKCKPYYLRTYNWNQLTGTNTSNTLNEHSLQLGNLTTQKKYTVKFPVQMTRNTPTTLNPIRAFIYTPITGITGEAFNVNKNADTHVQGLGSLALTNLPWDPNTIRPLGSQGQNISIGAVTKNAMDIEILNGAVSLDTLKFHYVIDSDFDPVQIIT